MAELPGWDRDRLRTAAPTDVQVARLITYVRHWRWLLTRDLGAELEDLHFANRKASAREVESRERKLRNVRIEELKELARVQAGVRERLGLEPA